MKRIKDEHGNLSVAEEAPLAFMAVRHIEVKQIPLGRALRPVPTVVDGEMVVLIRAQ